MLERREEEREEEGREGGEEEEGGRRTMRRKRGGRCREKGENVMIIMNIIMIYISPEGASARGTSKGDASNTVSNSRLGYLSTIMHQSMHMFMINYEGLIL